MGTVGRGRLPLSRKDGIERGPQIELYLNGQRTAAFLGETVAAVMIAEDGLATRRTASGASRGVYCGMGICFDCLVIVNGVPNTRACMTLVADGMRVEQQFAGAKT
ncbi:MAG: (2Fe-2S)-binding protein [Acidimicrobiales bacterium]